MILSVSCIEVHSISSSFVYRCLDVEGMGEASRWIRVYLAKLAILI